MAEVGSLRGAAELERDGGAVAGVAAAGAPRPRRWSAEASAIAAIAHRDFVKLLRDRVRLFSELAFPLILILLLGPALQSGFGSPGGLDLTTFVFTGVLAQTIWQSAALGLISLIADREEDFSQEIFVSPVSRYSIVAGKIIGESLVALPTGLGIVVVGLLIGAPLTPAVLALIPLSLVVAVYGGAFGLLILANISSQRTASQIFPFVMLPQFFLAGVFNPIHDLPTPLAVLSALSPMRYAVELTRNVFYGLDGGGRPAPDVAPLEVNVTVIVVSFLAFIAIGTVLFVRAERNR
ncbi:MAG: ABC transporter permease [Chloroflexi bacterium]|nr:ABC transporter permease [Chloroflexota bacterium]